MLQDLDDIDWMAFAKCRGIDPNYFYPGTSDEEFYKTRSITLIEEQRARFCHGIDDGIICPVKKQCGQYAVDKNIYGGVWGGMSHSQRLKLRKRKSVA